MKQPATLPPSDEELVKKAIKDKELFGMLIERYEAKLSRYIARLGVRNEDDRLDVLQDIFLKVYKNLNGFDTSLSFSSWIYRIAHNEAISWYRKKNVRPEGHMINDSEDILGLLSGQEISAEIETDRAFNAKELHRAIMTLPTKYREVIILRFFEHKEYDEISDILKIPVGSVGTLLHRGKKKLADELNQQALRI